MRLLQDCRAPSSSTLNAPQKTLGLSLWLVLGLALSSNALSEGATVYKKVDANGNVQYSDTPFEGSKAVEVAPLSTIKMTAPVVAPTATTKESSTQTMQYKSLRITEPSAEQSYVNTGGQVTLSLAIEPSLAESDSIQVKLNGVIKATQKSTTISLTNLDRGSYVVSAEVVGPSGKTLISSAPTTFHIKRSFKKAN